MADPAVGKSIPIVRTYRGEVRNLETVVGDASVLGGDVDHRTDSDIPEALKDNV
jgi:hypothetical protein